MERAVKRRNTRKTATKSFTYNIVEVSEQKLSPLQRLQKFKKLQEKQAKVQTNKSRKPGTKRVTFADEMTSEAVAVNGSHEPDIDKDEKILKPRKSILSNDQDKPLIQNGNNENGSVSENGDKVNENGFDGEIENGEEIKPNKRTPRQKNMQEGREGTPNRQSLLRESKTTKEPTPKPETPSKRELRQREVTPRKTTPKPEIANKRDSKPRGASSKYKHVLDGENEKKMEETKSDSNGNENEMDLKLEESVVIIEESVKEDNVVSIAESEDEVVKENPQEEKSFFSAFRRSNRRSSLETKNDCEASSSSVICLDTPSVNEEKIVPSKDIQGRRSINSFSRFPGRTVSITSLDKSLKRKADDSFEEEGRKRFAGETSGSEKSPGWHFFSPSLRIWSPRQSTKTPLTSSTPFHKREDQDSMAVNYDSKTKLDLDDSMEKEDTMSTKSKARKNWCSLM